MRLHTGAANKIASISFNDDLSCLACATSDGILKPRHAHTTRANAHLTYRVQPFYFDLVCSRAQTSSPCNAAFVSDFVSCGLHACRLPIACVSMCCLPSTWRHARFLVFSEYKTKKTKFIIPIGYDVCELICMHVLLRTHSLSLPFVLPHPLSPPISHPYSSQASA